MTATGLYAPGWQRLALASVMVVSAWSGAAYAEALDQRIDRLKSEVSQLSESLFTLEQQVLHPADTRLSVFLSLDNVEALELDSIELSIDGKPAASYLYSARELRSLQAGSLQQLYVGNVALGPHTLSVTMTGQGANDRYLRRETELDFRKRSGEAHLELVIAAEAPDFEPEVLLNHW